jgi:hypothetical protein
VGRPLGFTLMLLLTNINDRQDAASITANTMHACHHAALHGTSVTMPLVRQFLSAAHLHHNSTTPRITQRIQLLIALPTNTWHWLQHQQLFSSPRVSHGALYRQHAARLHTITHKSPSKSSTHARHVSCSPPLLTSSHVAAVTASSSSSSSSSSNSS